MNRSVRKEQECITVCSMGDGALPLLFLWHLPPWLKDIPQVAFSCLELRMTGILTTCSLFCR